MAVTRLVAAAGESVQPVGSSGTYTLAVALDPGLYKITTDTSQTLSTAQLYFQTAEGYRFGAAVRGGQGYVAIPQTVTTVTFTTGTFPLLIGFQKFASYSLIAAPTGISVDFTTAFSPYLGDVSFTPPAGATSIGVYWSNGTFTDFATTTSPKTSVTLPTAPTGGDVYPMLIVAKDANGVWGLGSGNTDPFPFYTFTTSGTFTLPEWATTSTYLAVGGGGGGGGSGPSPDRHGGYGGAGAAGEGTTSSASYAVVVGTGGAGAAGAIPYPNSGPAGGTGGTTIVDGVSFPGGLGGQSTGNNAAAAGGNSGNGFLGAPAVGNPYPFNSGQTRGGGGAGGNASTVLGGIGYTSTATFGATEVGMGWGGGGSLNGPGTNTNYGRSGGGGWNGGGGGTGYAGVVVIKANA